ncbi:MAG: cob(I)yrinic acid a,c-diamide adenosyltransferase [Lachnospiraceae bacterium]|nr:cob(I)yrinic acid a,c-diamide adenosyltransferase [Lachnospiraceae bacterium]
MEKENENRGKIIIYSGDGHGKTPAALGHAVVAAAEGQQVVIIQFLKGKGLGETEFVKRLEPEIKLFRFEKSDEDFMLLSEEKRTEEIMNIKNGMNYAKKVLSVHECGLLILDEVLGLIDNQIITVEELESVLGSKSDDTTVIMTGITLNDDVCMLADEVSRIDTVRFRKWED